MSNENWMGQLGERVRDLSIIHLAIPGSHNSMTYGINSKSKSAPDADSADRRLSAVFPWFYRRWAINQDVDVVEQLKLGVRFFDLRICNNDGIYYYCHGLYSMTIQGPLLTLITFLDAHPKEFVILDFQHFYKLEPKDHSQLQIYLKKIFGTKIYTRNDGPLIECTLNYCHSIGKQAIIIYRSSTVSLPEEFWPGSSWPTPWPNVCSSKELEEYLSMSLLTRSPICGFVSQCIFTPDAKYICLRLCSSLKNTAKKVEKKLEPWTALQQPGPFDNNGKPNVNVILLDFVNLKNGAFCQRVIDLNSSLECLELNE